MVSQRRTRRTAVAVLAAASLSALAGGAVAHADDGADQRFADAVAQLDIPIAPDQDLPAIGHKVCDMLNSGLAGAVNPVPVVRGVRNTLMESGITRAQAGGLLHAAVAVYCPENSSFVGR